MPSLQRRLLVLLAAPLIGLTFVSAYFSYSIAVNTARDAYDRSLLDPALALANYIRVEPGEAARLDLPQEAVDALRIDSTDRIVFVVLAPNGNRIAGNADDLRPPTSGPSASHVFFDVTLTEPKRAVALFVPSPHGRFTVIVAETLRKRSSLIREVLLASVLPEVVVGLASVAMLIIGVRLGLAPLERLRAEIGKRTPTDLRPFIQDEAPEEVRPLVASLNQLLGRLHRALDSQRQFIGNAAHQLRTPLAGLSAHAELALREPATGRLKELLQTLHGETKRTTHLVNQLLALARAEPRDVDATRPAIDLKEVVNAAASQAVQRALVRGIDLGFELESAPTRGDALLIRELLVNLLDNAIDYTPAGGAVTVRTGIAEGRAVLAVEDNGPGIAIAERERVFERFYRIPGTPAEGCGLGLAIVREIADRHAATVLIEGGPNGRGARVSVAFPLSAAI